MSVLSHTIKSGLPFIWWPLSYCSIQMSWPLSGHMRAGALCGGLCTVVSPIVGELCCRRFFVGRVRGRVTGKTGTSLCDAWRVEPQQIEPYTARTLDWLQRFDLAVQALHPLEDHRGRDVPTGILPFQTHISHKQTYSSWVYRPTGWLAEISDSTLTNNFSE